ncbi:MAG: ThuA domain-containing protein [Sedimentisphaerales bacterium]|nr:ThuA domain-containing protein [Sedimentisphaerales bacterium]
MGKRHLNHRKYIYLSTFVILSVQISFATDSLTINARKRIPSEDAPGAYRMVNDKQAWNPAQTAIIICDMWDQHWCRGATARVQDLAPVMNHVISLARNKGILIVHAPSGCMEAYKDHPARRQAIDTPKVALPEWIGQWNHQLDREKGLTWPVNQSDGGCDCKPQCRQHSPWKNQIHVIEIHNEDIISDSGIEISSIFDQRNIQNVILMGVHTNMCVIGRPFGLRNMARWGKNAVLMRDLTDTMYNSRSWPYVDHFAGTSRVIEYIETHICPTITSTDLTSKVPFRFSTDHRPKVVFLMAEKEYHADQRLPEFARLLEDRYHIACDFALGISKADGPKRHSIENMQTLRDADLAIVFIRRRALPDDQMLMLRDHLEAGKPLIGIRTASHAFDARAQVPDPDNKDHILAQWPEFDKEVLGGNYNGHYGNTEKGTRIAIAETASSSSILKGLSVHGFISEGSLYRSSPLSEKAAMLLIGQITDQEPEPVAWTHRYKKANIFSTSLGHWNDWEIPDFQQLMINAVLWALQ